MITNKNIKLPAGLISKLINEAETGIGYHRVDIIMNNGVVLKDMIIIYSSILLSENTDEINVEEIDGFFIHKK